MPLTAQQYQKYKPIAEGRSPRPEGMSDEYFGKLVDAVTAYEDDFGKRWASTQPKDEGAAPTGGLGVTRVLGTMKGGQVQRLPEPQPEPQLDPGLPLAPQALALAPATTHPQGDKAAKDEWYVAPENAKGSIVVYDAPVAVVRKALLDNPELLPALGYSDFIPTPQQITELDTKSSIYQAYNDYEWRKAAEEAAKAGKTAYRYSKAPWLQGGKLMNPLETLGMKLATSAVPANDAIQALVLGVDQYGMFGIGRRVTEAANDGLEALGVDTGARGDYDSGVRGGFAQARAQGMSQREEHDTLIQDNPRKYLLGQGLAALAPWSPANRAWDLVTSGGERLLERTLPGVASNAFGRIGASAVGAGAAGAALHAGEEGVAAVDSYLRTGDSGTTLDAAIERTGDAARVAAALGGGFQALGRLSGAHAEWTRAPEGRYDGAPERLEKAGVKFKFGKGPVAPPEYQSAANEARALSTSPEEVIAKRLEPTMSEGARAVHADARKAVAEEKRAFYPTEEGRAELPARNLVTTARDLLDKHHSPRRRGGKLEPVGVPNAGDNVYDVLNNNIEGISLEPVEGAIRFTPQQAARYLSPDHQRALLEMRPPRAPEVKPPFRSETEAAGPIQPQPRPVAVRGEPQPPPMLPTPKPGAGDWRNPRGVVGDPIAPTPTLDAVSTLENHARQRAVQTEMRAPKEAPVRGYAEPFTGPPPGASPGQPPGPRPAAAPNEGAGPAPKAAKPRSRKEIRQERAVVAAKAKDVEEHLARNGVGAVYVIPRKYDAAHTDQAVANIKHRGKATGERPADRDMDELRDALLADRKERTYQGKPGGWSERRAAQEQTIAKARDTRERVLPRSTETGPKVGAHQVLTKFAHPHQGELPTMEALREVADRQGVRPQLEQLRIQPDLKDVHRRINFGRSDNGRLPTPPGAGGSLTGRTFDFLNLRLGYPTANWLESLLGPLATGGNFGLIRPDERLRDRVEAEQAPKVDAYRARRNEAIANQHKPRKKAKKR